MPNLQQLTTAELLAEFQQYPLQQEVVDIISELSNRVIKEGDDDDVIIGEIAVVRGGVRPYHAPKV